MSAPNSGLARLRRTFRRPAFDPQAIAERNLREAEERREMYREQGRREAKNASWYTGYDAGYTEGWEAAKAQYHRQEPVKELSEGWTSAPGKSSFIDPLYAKES